MNTLLGIAKGLRRRRWDSVKADSLSHEKRTKSIQDMPVEVLEHIISFLPTSSIPRLMVNRAFRETCERILYRSINLSRAPGRTLHLCKTFVLRPDLALLVRELEISLTWFHVIPRRGTRAHTLPMFSDKTKARALTAIEALSLAKNVTSFDALGVAWASDRDMAPMRELACGMKLTRLTISIFPSLPNPIRDYDEEIVSYLHAVIQAQPLLEHLELPSSLIIHYTDPPNLTSNLTGLPPSETQGSFTIKWPDLPNLRSLTASLCVAAWFIAASQNLEELSISPCNGGNRYFYPRLQDPARRIRSLTLAMNTEEWWTRDYLGEILSSFPNVETLILRTWWHRIDVPMKAVTELVNQVLLHCHALTVLRKLDMSDVLFDRLATGQLLNEPFADLKARCPLLESVIDPYGCVWAYPPAAKHQQSPGLKKISRLSRLPKSPRGDIPYPETSKKGLSRGFRTPW